MSVRSARPNGEGDLPSDPYLALRRAVLSTAADAPGASDPALRASAFRGAGLPIDLAPLVETMRAHAYRVTDEQVAQLRRSHSDDALFEVIVNGALGAANERLEIGLRALEEA